MKKNKITRRDFLKMAGITSAGLALSACGVDVTKLPDSTATVTPSLTLFPTVTNTPTLTPTPMPPTIGDLARKIGMDVGVEGYYSVNAPANYVNTLLNYSILTDGYVSTPNSTDSEPKVAFSSLKAFSEFARLNNIKLNINHMFWGFGFFNDKNSPVRYLLKASKDEVEKWMKDRVKKFFEIPYFTHVNFVNEVLWGNDETGEFGWDSSSNPFYKIWGKDWVYEAYMIVYNEAVATGRKVGDDIRLIYNATPIEWDSPKARYEYKLLSDLKEKLKKELSIETPFDVGMEFHTRTVPLKEVVCWGPSASHLEKKTLIEHFKKFGEIGDIHVSEFSIATPDPKLEKEILHTVVESAIESGVCKSLIMWGAFASPDVSWADCNLQHLYEGNSNNPKPSYMFDELYKILQTYSAI
jgi:GH35 family endo-1,4-beta-xylanase